MTALVFAALLFHVQFNLQIIVAFHQVKSFIKVCEDAQIDATPTDQIKHIEDVETCALNYIIIIAFILILKKGTHPEEGVFM